MQQKKMVVQNVTAYSVICFSAVIFALMYHLFVIPNNFAPAGLNGVATMIQYKLGFSIGYFSLIINVPLCVCAYFFVNRQFALRSLVFCLVYSLAYLLLQKVDMSKVQYNANGVDTVFPCLIAGIISGTVYGICFRSNSSTGGTDIVAKMISKRKPLLNFFWVTFTINTIVAFSSLFVYGINAENGQFSLDYKPVCLCILYCFVSSFIGNRMLEGYKIAYKFMIVTPHSAEIEGEILNVLHHGATRLYGTGIFKNENKEILLCVVNKHQIVDFKNILKKYPNTFAFVEVVNETVGNFKKIK